MSSSRGSCRSAAMLIEGALGVDRVVEHDAVDDQAERIELFFLAFAVGLAELAAAAVADVAGEAVAAFAAVELDRGSRRRKVSSLQ